VGFWHFTITGKAIPSRARGFLGRAVLTSTDSYLPKVISRRYFPSDPR
jgi:hypothetical protein